MKHCRKQKGFTLIELLIVVAIVGVLAAIGIPMYNGYIANSKYISVKQNHKITSADSTVLLLNCDLKGSITVRANTAKPRGSNQTFICKNQNTNSISHLLRDHFHFLGFKNPLNGESLTWHWGTPKSGYLYFNGNPTSKCLIKITSTVVNPSTNKLETLSTQINMTGKVSQC